MQKNMSTEIKQTRTKSDMFYRSADELGEEFIQLELQTNHRISINHYLVVILGLKMYI